MKDHQTISKLSGLPIKGFLMLALSLGAGGAGVYFSQAYIEGQVLEQSAGAIVDEPMIEVIVPSRAMLRGEIVNSTDLVRRQIPAQYADSNSVSIDTLEMALGQRMDFDIDEGRPLLWAHLAGGVTPTFSGKVSTGLRAMTVRCQAEASSGAQGG